MDGCPNKHAAHEMLHIFETRGMRQLVDAHATALRGEVEEHTLGIDQRLLHVFFKVGIHADAGFALHFEPRGEGGLIDLTQRAQVVARHPVPELELRVAHDGLLVEQGDDLLQLIAGGLTVVHGRHYGRVDFFASKRHEDAVPHLERHVLRHAIGVGARYGKWQDGLDELRHGDG